MAIYSSDKQSWAEQVVRECRPSVAPFVSLYKDLHRSPELPGMEALTASLGANVLRDLGLDVQVNIGGNGVVGLFKNGPGRTIWLRAEMDALPIKEETGLPYRSVKRMIDSEGRDVPVMHACGHDIHIAALAASLQLLKNARKLWSGTVVAILQPAEESTTGAQAMIDDDLYNLAPEPDFVLAQHVVLDKAGYVALKTGPALPASEYIHLRFFSAGIGPNPMEGTSPIFVACNVVTAFAKTVQDVNAEDFALLTPRDYHAGEPGTLYTDTVNIRLELKTTRTDLRDQLIESLNKIVRTECDASDGIMKYDIKTEARAIMTFNKADVAEPFQRSFRHFFGDRFFVPAMDTPVEDFPLFRVPSNAPSLYWKLGSTEPTKWDEAKSKGGRLIEHLPFNHSPWFAPEPELTIETGMDAMALASLLILDEASAQRM